MRDSAAKRVFWLIIFGALIGALIYGSFIWSLSQTIQFTSLLVPGSRAGGVIFGMFIQFAPTAFLYMSSSFDANKPNEQNQRLWWLAAFWGVSIFDGLTNLGARFDDISVGGLQTFGFENEQFAAVASWMMIVMGVMLDFGIVFAEELLGNFLGVFFDNLAAMITLLGGNPPKWFAMVAATGRAVSGTGKHPGGNQPAFGGGKDPRGNKGGNRGNDPRGNDPRGGKVSGRKNRPMPNIPGIPGMQQRPAQGGQQQRPNPRNNVTITNMED